MTFKAIRGTWMMTGAATLRLRFRSDPLPVPQPATTPKSADRPPPPLLAVMPAVFVIFRAPGYGLPYAEPLILLACRFWIAAALFLAIAIATGAPRLGSVREAGHNVLVGVPLHGIYLGGVFSAIAYGMSTGLSALIVRSWPRRCAGISKAAENDQAASISRPVSAVWPARSPT